MQQLTVALSPLGISEVMAAVITRLMAGSFTAPDKPNVVQNQRIPVPPCTMQVTSISLSGGSVTNMSATLQQVTQTPGGNGTFNVSLTASFDVAYASWHEVGSTTCPNPLGNKFPPVPIDWDQTLSGFNFSISSATLSFQVQVATANGSFTVTVSNASETDVNVGAVNLPSGSNLNDPSVFSCINDRIKQSVVNAISHVDFAQALQSQLQGVLQAIPNSGNITSSIVYQFAPQNISFPSDSGIAAGVNGQVVWNGQQYSTSPAPTDVPLPAVPTTDFVANIGTYEFNALLWAFYQADSLNLTVTPGMIPDASFLNTTFYKTLLPALYTLWPDAPMEVQVAAANAPTVSDGPMYMVTSDELDTIVPALPSSVVNDLQYMLGQPFTDTANLTSAIAGALSSTDNTTHGAAIVAACPQQTAFYVTSTWNLTVNVIQAGVPGMAFVLQVVKNDLLTNFDFEVAGQGTVQTMTFGFFEMSTTETVTSTSSQLTTTEVNTATMQVVWSIVDNDIDNALQDVGLTGVPLPSVEGVLLENTVITFQTNYVTVESDLAYNAPASSDAASLIAESSPVAADTAVRVLSPA